MYVDAPPTRSAFTNKYSNIANTLAKTGTTLRPAVARCCTANNKYTNMFRLFPSFVSFERVEATPSTSASAKA